MDVFYNPTKVKRVKGVLVFSRRISFCSNYTLIFDELKIFCNTTISLYTGSIYKEQVELSLLLFLERIFKVASTPIKASDNRSQNSLVSLFNQITMRARSSPSQSWVDYTTSIAEVLEL